MKETVDAVVKKLSLTGRGKHKRRSYSAAYKLEAIQEVESGRKPDEVALQFGVHRTLIIEWVKDKVKIETVASSEFKEHLKIRPARKYKLLFAELLKVFKTQGAGATVLTLTGYGPRPESSNENRRMTLML